MRKLKIAAFLFAALVLILVAGFLLWARPMPAMQEAANGLRSDESVSISNNRWIVFEPAEKPARTGLIFFPGALVDPVAYAPVARNIASDGFLVVITKPTLNLAIFEPNVADRVMQDFPEVKNWVIGGHSLGGAVAASYAYRYPEKLRGVLFFGSYTLSSASLRGSKLQVTSVYGSADGVSTPAEVEASREFLPENAKFARIEGGNHAQFGWYGKQKGDGTASISREDQQRRAVDASVELLRSVDN